ncbi:uncharacterized protein LOC121644412 [Melanotaenia boesemani]|uniref:uncharacterized protein LOC121644412 n=1 Tax=Melanotaenia boesemani TaxID=1250792 RepID=UPI001C058A1F|nr:uncharacterized protein LOC121644412 [Melanotaenia boesemani]
MTAPCPPTDIEVIKDCDAQHALVIWQNHQASGLYTATIEDASGLQLNCTSNTVNNCTISPLPCAKKYNVTVSYNNGNCSSTSTPVRLESGPCSPEDVSSRMSCNTSEVIVTWNISVPADNYTTVISRGMGQTLYCYSTETKCIMGGLLCGSAYTLSVFSASGTCLSRPSSEVTVLSLPCPPTNITAQHTCAPDPLLVSWAASINSKFYTAVAVGSRGHRAECTTNKTLCSFPGLHCGEVYNISVAGADDSCRGQPSNPFSLNTEPCPPSNVTSQVICSAGAAQVLWSPSINAVRYEVQATSNNHTLTCSSSTSNCTLKNLVCGQAYDILVSATDGTCFSNSDPLRQDQVPCAPGNITTYLLCATNNLMVSWISSALPLNYSVTAMPLDGNISPVSCHTGNTSCVLSGLQCGQTYNVFVNASSGTCSGPNSPSQTIRTAPCPLQNLTAVTDCGTNSLLASWDAPPGTSSYTATVTGPSGFSKTCSSSNLTCSFSGLQCASQYNITATSQDNLCTSAPIQTTMKTGPCDPVNVTSILQCGADTATVSWAKAAGAVAYTVLAQEDGSYHYTSCRSSTTSCQLKQLQCGKVYNLTVMAEDATCNSTGATKEVLKTAPCSPSIQSSIPICANSSSLLSWTAMACATGYVVNATAANGHSVSCSTVTPSCTLTNLLCSKNYVATITARGNQCDSTPGPVTNITTAPCSPAITSKQYTCSNSSVLLRWSDPVGRLSFLAQVAGQGFQDSCHTTDTSCVFENLPCGLDLNVNVQAQGEKCNSSLSVSESLQTVPCAPENVNVTLKCSNHSALVKWVGSPSTTRFNITLTGQDGHTHHCHTNSTSCEVPNVHCGENYNVTAMPYSQTCMGTPSAPHSFRAGLCAPSSLTVSATCKDSTVSWTHVSGAEMYIATATANDGHTHTCSQNYTNSCNFTDLHCGETYAVTVVTVDRGCWSEPSSAVQLKGALCPPANLTGHLSCDTNMLTLTWSPVTGAAYILQWMRIGDTSPASEYTTSSTSYTLSNLLCGERYAFSIAAKEGNCSSSYSLPIEMTTAPCPPTNLTAQVYCGTNNGNFSWVESSRATFYIVEVTGENGHVVSCSSNDTFCAVKLLCGLQYSASLVASTESCNSSKHTDIYFDSAPCLPGNVVAELECDTNVMIVNWTQTSGSDVYTAWAISTDGHRASCNTTSHYCSINDLRCGKVYEVVVTSSSINCEIIAGSDYKIQSAPCRPENTTVEQNCSTNSMTVKWQDIGRAQNYTVKATSDLGVNATCDSSKSSCSFLNLSCGQLYNFSVMAHTNACMSEMSTQEKLTAPCPPATVSAEQNCTAHRALVSWSNTAASVATAYIVQATSSNGHKSSCSDMGTSCYLDNLVCGQDYSVAVEAINTGCPGPASSPAMLTTAPCVPVNISALYNVSNGWALWSAAAGASSYSVQAVTNQGLRVTCNTSNTNCFLNGLQCSQMYNVSVTAQNQACNSVTSETSYLMTEPCPPTNIKASVTCEQNTGTASWQQSNLAVGYVAYFDNQSGRSTSCVGKDTDTGCVVLGLMCGTVYSVWVKALGQQYNSSNSSMVSLTTGPCQPSSIVAIINCEAHSATISWQPSVGATFYITVLTALSGYTTSCSTNHTNCQLSSLPCGEEYNVTVKAVGDTCNSTAQMTGYLTTEPCVPASVSVHYNASTAQVMWDATKGASSYSVRAVTEQGLTATCNSSNTRCSLTGLQCSQIYNITVMTQNLACNNTVTSAPYQLMTEPCPPTNVQASVTCEQLNSTVSWQQSYLAVGYIAYFESQNGYNTSCVSTNTHTFCTVSQLKCGTEYSVWVKALGQQYNSSDSSVIAITSAPCLPSEVKVEIICQSDGAAEVSWNSIYGTGNVSVMADVGGSLQTLCTTQHNRCNVTGLSCGETYNLSLTVSNKQCSLTAPTHTNLTTRPCPPQHTAVNLQCGSSTATLSWERKSKVELYTACAIKVSGGDVKKCNSTGSTCQFPSLNCGESYNFTVKAYIQGCWSQASRAVLIQTEPCQPVNVSAEGFCQGEKVQISWHQAGGAVNYLVTAAGNLGYMETLNTTQTLLSATLPCGQHYNITVQGQGSECDSIPSNPAFIQTGPCVPWKLATYKQCEFNTGSVSWWPSDGAQSYVAIATGHDGHTHHCLTNTTSCTWNNLHCGEEYSVVVRAKADNCTSLPSNSSIIQMVPCIPHNLTTTVNCDMKVVSLSWNACNGTNLYVISAEGGNKSFTLSTNTTIAHFSELTCGLNYSLKIIPQSQHCPGTSSASAYVQTWPCTPMGISAMQDCLSSIVTVTWQPSNGSDFYTATIQANSGISEVCMSETAACSVPTLPCGHNFSVSVRASNQQCSITSSQTASLQSAPCQPQGIRGNLDCVTNSAWISWDPAAGANSYTVLAVGGKNYKANCTTSTNNTCEVPDLACGVLFNFTVTAKNNKCESQPSAAIALQTASCSLSDITAFTQCHNTSIFVVWDLMEGSKGSTVYTATAEASDQTFLSCNNTGTSCYLPGAQCGLRYTISVAASSDQCSDLRSPPYRISMEPCPPRGVIVNASCEEHSALVSWTPSPVAETYHVVAVAADGHEHTCNTTSTNCSVSELLCDQQYTVFVIASHENCSSKASENVTLNTGPCQPSGLSVNFHCHNQSAILTWVPSHNARNYYSYARAGNGDVLYCYSTNPTCTIDGLDCGTVYNFSVQASDETCNSSFSSPVQIGGAPCPPDAVKIQLMPMEKEIQVMHFSWTKITCGHTEYLLMLTGSLLGDSQALFELSSYWTNMTYFEIPLPCSSSYSATLQSRNAAGTSDKSVPLNGTTAPCPPSGVTYSGNSTFATVSWNASVFATTYFIYDNSVAPKAKLCNTTMLSCSFSNIAANNTVITASNAAGESQSTLVTNVVKQRRRRRDLSEQMTVGGSFSAPILDVTQTTPTVFFLQWSPVEDASYYKMVIRKQGSSIKNQELTVYGESIIVSDLSPNSTYCLSVLAIYTAAMGPESEPVCVQTGQGLRQ